MFDNDFGTISTQPFDTKNFKIYGNEFPPSYPVQNIVNFEIVLICGKNDQFCTTEDCEFLKEFLEKQNSLADFIECDRDH